MAGRCDRAAGDSPGSLGESRDRRGDRLRSLRYSWDRPGVRPLPTSCGTGGQGCHGQCQYSSGLVLGLERTWSPRGLGGVPHPAVFTLLNFI